MSSQSADVMVIAGEASGDQHGANLVEALKGRCPDIRLRGMGSDRLRAAGVDVLFDCKSIAVVGLFEVLLHWPDIKRALRTIETAITETPPDLLILIDYVEFNLRMAAVAQRMGVKVLFYVSPQIWAWRPERVHKIGTLVDMMAVIFPFEVKYYEQAGIPVRYVGHPLSGHVHSACSRESLTGELSINGEQKLVGLLPGSRANEIRYILPVMLDTVERLNNARSDITFLLPVAPTVRRADVEAQIQARGLPNIQVLNKRAYDVMSCSDSIAIASGTATLEAAMIGVPMAIVYKVNALSWYWMKRKIQIEHVGLANIVAEKSIVPEFIQENCRADLLFEELTRQLDDDAYRSKMLDDQAGIRAQLGNKNAAEEVAALAEHMLSECVS